APYIYAKGSYDRTKFKAPYYYDLESEDIIRHSNSASDNETRITADLGLGFDFFITPNLVLGTRLGWDIYKKGDFNSQTADKEFHLNSGFSLLFKKADQSSQQPLIDRYMKAGNMLIQGNLSYKRPRSNDDKFHQVSMLTETSYFISNRTEAIMKLGFDFVRIETWFDVNTNDRIVYSISDLNTGLGIRHHFKLNNNLFLAATGRVEIFSQRQLPQETNNRQTTIPISLDLVYFKNQSRFFLGNTYWRSNRSLFYDRRVKRKTQGYNTYLGFDYFFRPSIYLRSQLTTLIYTDAVRTYYDLPKLKDNLRRVNLSFTFGFLINS
ncbi:MAG: hypothetical protein AB8F74_19140, partial [Saprospiraceae bacterium]